MKNKIYKQSEEHRNKISLANLGKNKGKYIGRAPWNKNKKGLCKANSGTWEKGQHPSLATELQKGYKMPESWKKKIAEARRRNNPQGFQKGNKINREKGWKHSQETKERISKTRKERMASGKINLAANAGFKGEWRKTFVLPKKDTSIEIKIQNFLKQLNVEFFTHQYIKDIQHSYQCDILIPSMNLVIECFGDYWHKIPYGSIIDEVRCQELREKGYKVLVFWEREIKATEIDDLKNKLEEVKWKIA